MSSNDDIEKLTRAIANDPTTQDTQAPMFPSSVAIGNIARAYIALKQRANDLAKRERELLAAYDILRACLSELMAYGVVEKHIEQGIVAACIKADALLKGPQ